MIRITGHLVSSALAELTTECRATTGPLTLDLSELRQADEESLALLRRLAATGAVLGGASPYFAMLLAPIDEPLKSESST